MPPEPLEQLRRFDQPGIMLPAVPAQAVAVMERQRGGKALPHVALDRRPAQATTMVEPLRILADPKCLAKRGDLSGVASVEQDLHTEGVVSHHPTGQHAQASDSGEHAIQLGL